MQLCFLQIYETANSVFLVPGIIGLSYLQLIDCPVHGLWWDDFFIAFFL